MFTKVMGGACLGLRDCCCLRGPDGGTPFTRRWGTCQTGEEEQVDADDGWVEVRVYLAPFLPPSVFGFLYGVDHL